MTDLPQGWEWSTLGEVGRYLNGRGFKKTEWSERGRPIIRIQNLTGSGSSFNRYEGEAEDRHVVRDGDLLVSWAATLGVFVWRGEEGVLNQHIFKVESGLHPTFHRYLLAHCLADLERQTHGSGIVHITKGKFDSTPVPVPPMAEQGQIVAAIEEHLSRLDAAEAQLRAAAQRCAVLTGRVIDSSLEGEVVPLASLLREPLRNGLSAKASARGTVRVVTLTAVTKADFSDRHSKLIEPTSRSIDDLWMEPGDVFIQRSNTPELVGTSALFRGPARWAIFPDLLIRVRAREDVLPEYLELVLRSSAVRRHYRSSAQGIAGSMPKISQPIVEATPIPVPDVATQRVIVTTATERLDTISRTRREIEHGLGRIAALRRAILAAAFRGELAPQDPEDEPASVLLERIRAGRSVGRPAGV